MACSAVNRTSDWRWLLESDLVSRRLTAGSQRGLTRYTSLRSLPWVLATLAKVLCTSLRVVALSTEESESFLHSKAAPYKRATVLSSQKAQRRRHIINPCTKSLPMPFPDV